jgi:hypothetical protein
MKRHLIAVGPLFLVLAVISGVSRAQDVAQPLEPITAPVDAFQQGDFALDDVKGKASCSACPCVYGYAEMLFLERSNCSFDQAILVETIDANPGDTLFSTSDLDFDYEPALRVVLGRRLHNGWAIEGGYFGLWDASTAEFYTPPDGVDVAFPDGLVASNVFGDPDRIWTDYSSSLHGGELNLVCCRGCCSTCESGKGKDDSKGDCGACCLHCRTFEWFVGFRYLNLREHLRIYGEREQQTGDGTFAVESGVYDIRTSNNLFGPQLGARVRRWGRRLGWEMAGRAGIFGSDAQQEQYLIDYDQYAIRPLTSAARGQVAFVGDLNFTGIYRLNDVWNLRAGYNLMWISGVALAPDQLDFDATLPSGDQIASDGSVFLHGVSFGVEARW